MKYSARLTILIIIFVLQGCNKKESNLETFNKYYQKNLAICVKTMTKNGIDSVAANKKCSCMLNTLYQIDSNFIKKEGKELEEFIDTNREKIESECE